MLSSKLISICIPTYNRARHLGEALASIVPQMDNDVEIVISDNASTDNTREMVRQYEEKFGSIRYFRNVTNLGFDRNLLACLEHAEGEYVWLFGSDDLMKPGAVEAVRQSLRDQPVFVYLNFQVISPEGDLLIGPKIEIPENRDFRDGLACIQELGGNLGYMSAALIRRERCPRVPPDHELVGYGWIHLHMILRFLRESGIVRYIGQPLVQARRTPSLEYNFAERMVTELDRVIWHARRDGYARSTLRKLTNKIIREFQLGHAVGLKCAGHPEFGQFVLACFKRYWTYPLFWLLIVSVFLVPRGVLLPIRDYLRARRAASVLSASIKGTDSRTSCGAAPTRLHSPGATYKQAFFEKRTGGGREN